MSRYGAVLDQTGIGEPEQITMRTRGRHAGGGRDLAQGRWPSERCNHTQQRNGHDDGTVAVARQAFSLRLGFVAFFAWGGPGHHYLACLKRDNSPSLCPSGRRPATLAALDFRRKNRQYRNS